jgi:hypothetical protein
MMKSKRDEDLAVAQAVAQAEVQRKAAYIEEARRVLNGAEQDLPLVGAAVRMRKELNALRGCQADLQAYRQIDRRVRKVLGAEEDETTEAAAERLLARWGRARAELEAQGIPAGNEEDDEGDDEGIGGYASGGCVIEPLPDARDALSEAIGIVMGMGGIDTEMSKAIMARLRRVRVALEDGEYDDC